MKRNKKDKAERMFCSFVAKLLKDNWELIFRNKKEADFIVKKVRKNIQKAFTELNSMNKNLTKDIIFFPNDNTCFVKTDINIIRLYSDSAWEVEKVSFVKLKFEEISYKEAKANNSDDFQLAKWISDNK